MSKIFSILDEEFFEANKSKETERNERREKHSTCISSLSLIDDCISSFEASREKQKLPYLLEKKDSIAKDEDSSTDLINADLPRRNDVRRQWSAGDFLIDAARNRIGREKIKRRQKLKEGKNEKKQHVNGLFLHSKYTSNGIKGESTRKVKVVHGSKEKTVLTLPLSKEEKEDFLSDGEEDNEIVKEQKSSVGSVERDKKRSNREDECTAFDCMNSFIEDIKKIVKKHQSGSLQNDDLEDFARLLEETYIHKSLDKLDEQNETVRKVKKLIHTFSMKCSSPIVDIEKLLSIVKGTKQSKYDGKSKEKKIKTYTWNCAICEKKGQSMQSITCSVCGHRRGYKASNLKGRSLGKDITGNDVRRNCYSKTSDVDFVESSADDRRKVHFLQRKLDYEILERSKFAKEVGNVISSLPPLSDRTW